MLKKIFFSIFFISIINDAKTLNKHIENYMLLFLLQKNIMII